MKYRYKSIKGAVRRIRQLEKINAVQNELLNLWGDQRKALALLAAEGKVFDNILHAWAAKQIRDEILAGMNMNPDGTRLRK